jgi:N6-adenosine-specific RNA methylase IME4/ParB-like chromosome segregation protein Spo0J
MDFHPAANLFPLLEGADFDALVEDIRVSGLLEPILVDRASDTIIDGRNRYRGCVEAGVKPRFDWWEGSDPVAFVVSMNLHRRHLSESQRAMVAAKAATMQQGARTDIAQICAMSQPEAATLLNTSRRSVQSARHVIDHGTPELVQAVERGTVPVSTAARVAELPAEKQMRLVQKVESGEAKSMVDASRLVKREDIAIEPPQSAGKYRVIYADPPWEYGNVGPDYYGPAKRHYPTMSLTELCALPIEPLVEDNAVLFLWVTSPMLEAAFPLLKAWGFRYKSSFVWDKVRHNFGHYNSVRHELLLIATRGSCTPDAKELVDSVQEIERSSKHSEKPEEFRQIIDTLYPHGRRIELFARKQVNGWEVWGNECPASG